MVEDGVLPYSVENGGKVSASGYKTWMCKTSVVVSNYYETILQFPKRVGTSTALGAKNNVLVKEHERNRYYVTENQMFLACSLCSSKHSVCSFNVLSIKHWSLPPVPSSAESLSTLVVL